MEELAACFADLSEQQRLFVEHLLSGESKTAAARAAGYSRPDHDGPRVSRLPAVQKAINRARVVSAQALGRTREDLDRKLEEAYEAAENATEMVTVIRAMMDLHGLKAPSKVEIDQTVRGRVEHAHSEIRNLPDAELYKLLDRPPPLEGEWERVTDDRDKQHHDQAL